MLCILFYLSLALEAGEPVLCILFCLSLALRARDPVLVLEQAGFSGWRTQTSGSE